MIRAVVPTRLSMLACVGVLLASLFSVLPLTGLSGADLAVAALSVVALVAVAVVSVPGIASADLIGRDTAFHRARLSPRTPPRQCDPDAAGHARPRAPGLG